jgi:formylmethanofuran dehydrogenase subunit B
MKTCRFGVVLFDPSIDRRVAEALIRLVAELNDHARFYIQSLSNECSGSHSTLAWQTGYPFAVNFAGGAPRFNADEFSANRLLERKAVDACLVLGSEALARLSNLATNHLKSVPVIGIDPQAAKPPFTFAVQFSVATFGINTPGIATRMDGITVPLKVLIRSEDPLDEEILHRISMNC